MATAVSADLIEQARALTGKLSQHRRHLHANPELSFVENETAAYIAAELKALGYQVKERVGGTGLTADIGNGAKLVILRADMDALPITEENPAEYCSKNTGVMHACGHDAHISCLLGAAALLAANPPKNGRIRLLFQPAEEATNKDGKSGATLMIEDGAIKDAQAVIGLHVFPQIEVGRVAVKAGPVLAACDTFEIKIKGKASHGAWPQLGIDAIVLAAQVVQAVQTVISRRKSALEPAVLTIGGIKSTTYRPNIIAEEVSLVGTARYFNPELQTMIVEELKRACSIVEPLGGQYELNWVPENPPLVNDPKLTAVVQATAEEILGPEGLIEGWMEMGAEDFSFLSNALPGCFFFLGVKLPGKERGLHTPTFDLDESALPLGSAMLVKSALNYLDELR